MKNILIVLCLFGVVACGNNSSNSDSTPTATDTTGLSNNPATKDPTSNPADTMQMKDSIRVKDTSHKKSKSR